MRVSEPSPSISIFMDKFATKIGLRLASLSRPQHVNQGLSRPSAPPCRRFVLLFCLRSGIITVTSADFRFTAGARRDNHTLPLARKQGRFSYSHDYQEV